MVAMKSRIVRGSWSGAEMRGLNMAWTNSNFIQPKPFDPICRCEDIPGFKWATEKNLPHWLCLDRGMPFTPCELDVIYREFRKPYQIANCNMVFFTVTGASMGLCTHVWSLYFWTPIAWDFLTFVWHIWFCWAMLGAGGSCKETAIQRCFLHRDVVISGRSLDLTVI